MDKQTTTLKPRRFERRERVLYTGTHEHAAALICALYSARFGLHFFYDEVDSVNKTGCVLVQDDVKATELHSVKTFVAGYEAGYSEARQQCGRERDAELAARE